MKHVITHNDENFAAALNYAGTKFYNNPTTIQLGKKLYILGSGTTDTITVRKRKNTVYVVSVNKCLEYIAMFVIDDYITNDSVYLSSNDLNDSENICFGLLDKTTFQQIKILSEYL